MGLWLGHSEVNRGSLRTEDQLSLWRDVRSFYVVGVPSCSDWPHSFHRVLDWLRGVRSVDERGADTLHDCLQHDWKFRHSDHADAAHADPFLLCQHVFLRLKPEPHLPDRAGAAGLGTDSDHQIWGESEALIVCAFHRNQSELSDILWFSDELSFYFLIISI